MRFRRNFKADAEARAAQVALLREILELDCDCAPEFGPSIWRPFAFFEPDGRCAATLDAALLPLVVDGATITTGAIRAVATHPDYRGRGLFRALMEVSLAWFEAEGAALVLLYSAEPAIYARFGFREVPQHSFAGDAPARTNLVPTRRLRLDDAAHRQLIGDIVKARGPVSSRCALQIDPNQYVINLRGDPSLSLVHLTEAAALLVFEQDDQETRIIDYVTCTPPSIAQIVGAIPGTPRRLRTMFAPDRLDWHGCPELECTGLMMRGALPPALAAPFMLPPTAEF